VATLRERFDQKQLTLENRELIVGDFVVESSSLSRLPGYEAAEQTVELLESPLAVRRHLDLRQENAHRAIAVDLVLCLEGRSDAVERLFWAVESFQRDLPDESVARLDGVRDFGLAWGWDPGTPRHMVALVRNNLVVTLFAHELLDMESVAAELDSTLPQETVDAYRPSSAGILTRAREAAGGGEIRVEAGSRLALGAPVSLPDDTLFFLATGGSINRDPDRTEERFFRAGLE
jgi:hypothetical protein